MRQIKSTAKLVTLLLTVLSLAACQRVSTGGPVQLSAPTETLELQNIALIRSFPDGFYLLGKPANQDYADLYYSSDGENWQQKKLDIFAATAGHAGIMGTTGKVMVHHGQREGYGYCISTSVDHGDNWVERVIQREAGFGAVLAANDDRIARLDKEGLKLSDDGGKTWSEADPNVMLAPDGFVGKELTDFRLGTRLLVIDEKNRIQVFRDDLDFITESGAPSGMAIHYARSENGKDWSSRFIGGIFSDWKASANPGDPELLGVTFIERKSGSLSGRQVKLALSTDAGKSWSEPFTISSSDDDKADLDFAMDGSTLVATFRGDAGEGKGFYALVSSDRGKNWSKAQKIFEKGDLSGLAVKGDTVVFLVRDGDCKVLVSKLKG